MNSVSVADIEYRLGNLRSEHDQLEQSLERLNRDLLADDQEVRQIKKRKLQIKDSIVNLEDHLSANTS